MNQPPVFIQPTVAGEVIGFAKQTAYNKCSNGTFPLPLFDVAGRRMCKQSDLDAYILNIKAIPKSAKQDGRKRGRPTKANSIAAEQARGVAK